MRTNTTRSLAAALITVAGLTAAPVSAEDVKLPGTLTWTAYDTGSSGFNIAVAVGKTLKDKHGTDVRVLPAGTVTDAGVIATSLPLPNTPSPPLRSSLNVVVSTVVALSSRSNATVIDAGRVVTVEPGNGDTDDTRIAALLMSRAEPERKVHALISEANGRGGLDNITAIVVHIAPDDDGMSSARTTEMPIQPTR